MSSWTYRDGPSPALQRLLIFGHSYGVDLIGISTDLTALLGSTTTNNAVSSSCLIQDNNPVAGQPQANTGGWVTLVHGFAPTTGPSVDVALLYHGLNDIAMCGHSGLSTTFAPVLRACIDRLRARRVWEDNDPSFAFTGTWDLQQSAAVQTFASGTTLNATVDPAARATITLPSTYQGGTISVGFVSIAGFGPSFSTYGANWTATVNGTPVGSTSTFGIGLQSEIDCATMRLEGSFSPGQVINLTPSGIVGDTYVDYWQEEAASPGIVVLPLVNRLPAAGYARYSLFPHFPTDADVTAINALIQSVADEYPQGEVIAVETDDLINADPALLLPDQVHPNATGASLIAERLYEEILAVVPSGATYEGDPIATYN